MGWPLDASHCAAFRRCQFELQDGIDHVFQNLWSCYASFLVDVSDEQDRDVALLGILEQLGCALANLCDTTWGRLDALRCHGLDRVDDNELWLYRFDVFEHRFNHGFAHYLCVGELGCSPVGVGSEYLAFEDAVGAKFELSCAFFTTHIENLHAVEMEDSLENEGGFADAWFSAEKRE